MSRTAHFAALLAALVPAAAGAQEDPPKGQAARPDIKTRAAFERSTNNLKQIGIALHNYHEATDRLPAQAIVDKAGKPLLSWRVAILPYFEGGDALHKQFKLDQAWDSPANKKLLAQMPAVYASPGSKPSPAGTTRYLAFAGPDVGFTEQGLEFRSFKDGLSNTVAVAEAAEGVPWTKPADFQIAKFVEGVKHGDFPGKDAKLEFFDHGGLGWLVLMFDGSVQKFMTFDRRVFSKLLTRNGGEPLGLEEVERLHKPIPPPPAWARSPSPFSKGIRAQAVDNLARIGLSMHFYHSRSNEFLAQAICGTDGKPLLSWRVTILQLIDPDLYGRFKLNESWDSPHNLKLVEEMPKGYALPGKEGKPGETYYQVFVGKDAGFDVKQGRAIQDVRDGTSSTILAIEAPEPVIWTKPEDIEYERGKAPKLVGHFGGKLHIVMMDGSVRVIDAEQRAMLMEALITPAGGEAIDPDAIPEAKRVYPAAISARNLKEIGGAMFDFHFGNSATPPRANIAPSKAPTLSWRVALLPALGQQDLHKQFKLDEPWDGPHNKALIPKMPAIYAPPGRLAGEGKTYYQVFVGKDASFETPEVPLGPRTDRLRDRDSPTVLVIEAPEPVIWTKPEDIEYRRGTAPRLVAHADGRLQAYMWSGEVVSIDPAIHPALLEALITPAGGEAVAPEILNGRQ